jgi:hypothetical protein
MISTPGYRILATVAVIGLAPAGAGVAQTRNPLVGCYSPVGSDTIALQVAQNADQIHMALGYESSRNIFFEQTLAHEMRRQWLIDKGGFKEEEIEKFSSNLFMDDCGPCVVGVIHVKSGESVPSFEKLTDDVNQRTDYFAFLGLVATWVKKVDCP